MWKRSHRLEHGHKTIKNIDKRTAQTIVSECAAEFEIPRRHEGFDAVFHVRKEEDLNSMVIHLKQGLPLELAGEGTGTAVGEKGYRYLMAEDAEAFCVAKPMEWVSEGVGRKGPAGERDGAAKGDVGAKGSTTNGLGGGREQSSGYGAFSPPGKGGGPGKGYTKICLGCQSTMTFLHIKCSVCGDFVKGGGAKGGGGHQQQHGGGGAKGGHQQQHGGGKAGGSQGKKGSKGKGKGGNKGKGQGELVASFFT